ncbi:MAG: cell division protein FtsA [Parvibaculales bacterium]
MNRPLRHHQFSPRPTRSGAVAVLDIGTSKISCFVAAQSEAVENRVMHIKGVGYSVASGIRAGMVVDMEAAETSIRAAVEAAERMADTTVERVLVGISSSELNSLTYNVNEPLYGQAVDDDILAGVLQQARDKCVTDQVELLHAIPVSYKIDNSPAVQDPRGMHGEMLKVTTHVMTVPVTPVRNLLLCIEKCHLEVERLIATPYASALSCLVEDEADLGVTVIDMGAGTTSFTVFYEGVPIHTSVLPVGGHKITTDIAQSFNIPVEQAERLKLMHGSAWADTDALNESFNIQPFGETEAHHTQSVDRAHLTRVIRPRLETIFEQVRNSLENSALNRFAGGRAVLTGGGANLSGIEDLAAQTLEKQVRIGRPMRLSGLPDAMAGPAFSASAGLVTHVYKRTQDYLFLSDGGASNLGVLGSIGQWLKRNF